jgi:hypothetical protein
VAASAHIAISLNAFLMTFSSLAVTTLLHDPQTADSADFKFCEVISPQLHHQFETRQLQPDRRRERRLIQCALYQKRHFPLVIRATLVFDGKRPKTGIFDDSSDRTSARS